MTLATLLIAGAGLLSRPLYTSVENGDAGALLDQAEAEVRNVLTALDQERKAIDQARAGLACLNGTGACPDGQPNPFGRP